MLKIINLYVIDKIFEESESKLSARARMLYINCLTHHFKNKSATVSGAMAFELFEGDFGNYSKYEKTMQELHKAGLVYIGNNSISFHNLWGKHIDRNQLEKVKVEEYVAGFSMQGVESFEGDLKGHKSMIELAEMKYGIKREDVLKLVDLFIKEQKAFDKKYINIPDCIKHFTYWLPNNTKLVVKDQNKVKSQGKILGI